ncbi:hypothetical protein Tco_0795447 [Tanacetum coccineum]
MAAQLPGLQEEVLKGIFIKRLKQELRTAVRTQQPVGLGRTMELALVIDESRSERVIETHKVATSKPTTRFTGGIAPNSNALTRDGSKDKTTIAMHATQYEYMAASEAAMEAVWIRKFVGDLGVMPSINKPINMY